MKYLMLIMLILGGCNTEDNEFNKRHLDILEERLNHLENEQVKGAAKILIIERKLCKTKYDAALVPLTNGLVVYNDIEDIRVVVNSGKKWSLLDINSTKIEAFKGNSEQELRQYFKENGYTTSISCQ